MPQLETLDFLRQRVLSTSIVDKKGSLFLQTKSSLFLKIKENIIENIEASLSFFTSVRRALRKEFLNPCRKFSKAILVFGPCPKNTLKKGSFLLVLFFGEAKKRNSKKDFSFSFERTAR